MQGNKLLVTTAVANKLIADVWFARADFAKDHPEIIEGLVRGIFDAMEELKEDSAKQKVAELMASRLQHSRHRKRWPCWPTPTARTGPRTISSS